MWFKELGLNHYKARIYSPKLGRFLQTDPIFYADNMNMYAYVGNDPVNLIDPLGLFDTRDGIKLTLATGSLVLSGAETLAGGTLVVVSGAATMSGVGTAPGAAGVIAGLGVTAHGAYGVASALQDIQNVVEGTDYGSPAEQLGEAIAGEAGEKVGEAVDTGLTVLGGANGARNLATGAAEKIKIDNVADKVGDAHAVAENGVLIEESRDKNRLEEMK